MDGIRNHTSKVINSLQNWSWVIFLRITLELIFKLPLNIECNCTGGSGQGVDIITSVLKILVNSFIPGVFGFVAVHNLLELPRSVKKRGKMQCPTTSHQHYQSLLGVPMNTMRHLIHKLSQNHIRVCCGWHQLQVTLLQCVERRPLLASLKDTSRGIWKEFQKETVSVEPQTLEGASRPRDTAHITPSHKPRCRSHRHNTSIHKPHVIKR